MSALPRLLDDPSVSEKLRADLRRSQMHAVAPFDTAAGLERLRAGMKAGGGPMTPAGGGSLPGSSWKLLAALGVVGAVGWLLLSGRPESGTDSLNERPSGPVTIAPLEESGPESAAPSTADAPKAPSLGAEKDEPVTALSRASATPPSVQEGSSAVALSAQGAAARSAADSFADEISHLGSLRQLHHTDPAAAVVSARDGHRKFPQGVLYEEREALLILSLVQVGRRADAERQAADFRARFPRSAFLAKMEQIVPASQESQAVSP